MALQGFDVATAKYVARIASISVFDSPARSRNEGHHNFGATDSDAVCNFQEIISEKFLEFPVHRHKVLTGPFALGIVGKSDVIGGGQLPGIPWRSRKAIFLV
jgi:hypothetical protein